MKMTTQSAKRVYISSDFEHVTLTVTLTSDKQPEIPQREVRTWATASPEESEAIAKVCLPKERGLVTGCYDSKGAALLARPCTQPGTARACVLALCDPEDVSGEVCATPVPRPMRGLGLCFPQGGLLTGTPLQNDARRGKYRNWRLK